MIPEGSAALVNFMESKGYIHYMILQRPYTHDYIFVKEDILLPERRIHLPILDSNYSAAWSKRASFYV